MPRLSEAVYIGLCQEVGTQSELRIRREVVDTGREVVRNTGIMCGHDQMASGSYREGFRLESSDIDIMSWSTTHQVICDLSQISLTNPQHTIFLMECDDLPSGYTWSSSTLVLQNPIRPCILCI